MAEQIGPRRWPEGIHAGEGMPMNHRGDLMAIYQALKNKYRNYDTKYALKRMQAFRRSIHELNAKGFPLAIELLGSINFGIVDPSSDADCIILHFCDMHADGGECMPSCPTLHFERDELNKLVRKQLSEDGIRLEILDCINLTYIENFLKSGRTDEDSIIFRFLFYRTMGRPVNRPLFIDFYEKLAEIESIWPAFNKWAAIALRAYLSTSDHRYSFNKYNERILNQKLALPEGLREELKQYLDS